MDLYSSFAGFVEFIASPGEIIVDDNLLGEHPWLKFMIEPVFLYGSLPRPPDLQSPMTGGDFVRQSYAESFVFEKKKITVKDSTSQKQGELIIVDWLFKRHLALLLHLPFAQVYDSVSLFYKEEDKPVAVTLYGQSKVGVLALLHLGDGSFVGQEHVDDSDRLSTFIFGSLTRPPEAHCVFCFRPLTFTSMLLSMRRL